MVGTKDGVVWARDVDDLFTKVGPYTLMVTSHKTRRAQKPDLDAMVLRGDIVHKVDGPFNDEQRAQDAAIRLMREHVSEEIGMLAKIGVLLGDNTQVDTSANTTVTGELDQLHAKISMLRQRATDGDIAVNDFRTSPILRHRIDGSPEERTWESCQKQYGDILHQLVQIEEVHKLATALRRIGRTDKADKACRVLIDDMQTKLATVQPAINVAEFNASSGMIVLAYKNLEPSTEAQ